MFKLRIITPKGEYLTKDVESLTLKLTSGYRTILTGHAEMIGTLDYAPMHFINEGKTQSFALHGGAINVKKDEVILIVNAIEAKEDIDISRAKEAKIRAETRLNDKKEGLDIKRARLALARAISRIKTYEE